MEIPIEDLCLAYRYCYYVLAESVISDSEYDQLEAKARLWVAAEHALNRPGSDQEESYPVSIRLLGRYLAAKYLEG